MANYVQIVTYRKLPSGKKHYTENVIAESPVVAQDALKEAKGNIEIIDNKTTLISMLSEDDLNDSIQVLLCPIYKQSPINLVVKSILKKLLLIHLKRQN